MRKVRTLMLGVSLAALSVPAYATDWFAQAYSKKMGRPVNAQQADDLTRSPVLTQKMSQIAPAIAPEDFDEAYALAKDPSKPAEEIINAVGVGTVLGDLALPQTDGNVALVKSIKSAGVKRTDITKKLVKAAKWLSEGDTKALGVIIYDPDAFELRAAQYCRSKKIDPTKDEFDGIANLVEVAGLKSDDDRIAEAVRLQKNVLGPLGKTLTTKELDIALHVNKTSGIVGGVDADQLEAALFYVNNWHADPTADQINSMVGAKKDLGKAVRLYLAKRGVALDPDNIKAAKVFHNLGHETPTEMEVIGWAKDTKTRSIREYLVTKKLDSAEPKFRDAMAEFVAAGRKDPRPEDIVGLAKADPAEKAMRVYLASVFLDSTNLEFHKALAAFDSAGRADPTKGDIEEWVLDDSAENRAVREYLAGLGLLSTNEQYRNAVAAFGGVLKISPIKGIKKEIKGWANNQKEREARAAVFAAGLSTKTKGLIGAAQEFIDVEYRNPTDLDLIGFEAAGFAEKEARVHLATLKIYAAGKDFKDFVNAMAEFQGAAPGYKPRLDELKGLIAADTKPDEKAARLGLARVGLDSDNPSFVSAAEAYLLNGVKNPSKSDLEEVAKTKNPSEQKARVYLKNVVGLDWGNEGLIKSAEALLVVNKNPSKRAIEGLANAADEDKPACLIMAKLKLTTNTDNLNAIKEFLKEKHVPQKKEVEQLVKNPTETAERVHLAKKGVPVKAITADVIGATKAFLDAKLDPSWEEIEELSKFPKEAAERVHLSTLNIHAADSDFKKFLNAMAEFQGVAKGYKPTLDELKGLVDAAKDPAKKSARLYLAHVGLDSNDPSLVSAAEAYLLNDLKNPSKPDLEEVAKTKKPSEQRARVYLKKVGLEWENEGLIKSAEALLVDNEHTSTDAIEGLSKAKGGEVNLRLYLNKVKFDATKIDDHALEATAACLIETLEPTKEAIAGLADSIKAKDTDETKARMQLVRVKFDATKITKDVLDATKAFGDFNASWDEIEGVLNNPAEAAERVHLAKKKVLAASIDSKMCAATKAFLDEKLDASPDQIAEVLADPTHAAERVRLAKIGFDATAINGDVLAITKECLNLKLTPTKDDIVGLAKVAADPDETKARMTLLSVGFSSTARELIDAAKDIFVKEPTAKPTGEAIKIASEYLDQGKKYKADDLANVVLATRIKPVVVKPTHVKAVRHLLLGVGASMNAFADPELESVWRLQQKTSNGLLAAINEPSAEIIEAEKYVCKKLNIDNYTEAHLECVTLCAGKVDDLSKRELNMYESAKPGKARKTLIKKFTGNGLKQERFK